MHGSFLKYVLLAVLCRTALHLLCILEQGTDPFSFFKTKNKKKKKKKKKKKYKNHVCPQESSGWILLLENLLHAFTLRFVQNRI